MGEKLKFLTWFDLLSEFLSSEDSPRRESFAEVYMSGVKYSDINEMLRMKRQPCNLIAIISSTSLGTGLPRLIQGRNVGNFLFS